MNFHAYQIYILLSTIKLYFLSNKIYFKIADFFTCEYIVFRYAPKLTRKPFIFVYFKIFMFS